jgi:hypothetical protein
MPCAPIVTKKPRTPVTGGVAVVVIAGLRRRSSLCRESSGAGKSRVILLRQGGAQVAGEFFTVNTIAELRHTEIRGRDKGPPPMYSARAAGPWPEWGHGTSPGHGDPGRGVAGAGDRLSHHEFLAGVHVPPHAVVQTPDRRPRDSL